MYMAQPFRKEPHTSSPQNKTELCDTKQFTNTTPLRMQDILVLILNLGHISQNI